MGCIDNFLALINEKINKTNKMMIEKNPEEIMDSAIREAKIEYAKKEDNIARMKVNLNKQTVAIDEKKSNLSKIRVLKAQCQREGDTEGVKEANSLYKEREGELVSLINTQKETEKLLGEVIEYMQNKRKEIEKLETEKTSLLIRLENTKTKDELLSLTSSIFEDKSVTRKFGETKKVIEEKIGVIDARVEINNVGTKTTGRFKGL